MKKIVTIVLIASVLSGCTSINLRYVDELPGMANEPDNEAVIAFKDLRTEEISGYYTHRDSIFWFDKATGGLYGRKLADVKAVEISQKNIGFLVGCTSGGAAGGLLGGTLFALAIAIDEASDGSYLSKRDTYFYSVLSGALIAGIYNGIRMREKTKNILILTGRSKK